MATFVVNPCHKSVPGSREESQKKEEDRMMNTDVSTLYNIDRY